MQLNYLVMHIVFVLATVKVSITLMYTLPSSYVPAHIVLIMFLVFTNLPMNTLFPLIENNFIIIIWSYYTLIYVCNGLVQYTYKYNIYDKYLIIALVGDSIHIPSYTVRV